MLLVQEATQKPEAFLAPGPDQGVAILGVGDRRAAAAGREKAVSSRCRLEWFPRRAARAGARE
jgi:hypothetical protein